MREDREVRSIEKGEAVLISPLEGKSTLVTGGTGSFGHAFVKRALADGARRVVVFSRGEAKQAQMKAEFNDERLRFVIGDVRDATRVLDACRGVDILIHAAALKRVEVCEQDPNEAIATNIYGTMNVSRACIERGISQAILLSTDKAAAPNTLYGSTKLVAERLWSSANIYSASTHTRFAVCRYGNVAGSTGSLIPLWKAQAQSGYITITDTRMTRFFMSIGEAVDLVILALLKMRGAEIFVPKLGHARLIDLADQFVTAPVELRETGIRPGEKLHESLVTEDEARNTYDCGSYFVIEPDVRTWGNVKPLPYPKVSEDFQYRSDRSPKLSDDEMRRLAA